MAAERSSHHISVEAWRALERESHDAKHEYIDGQIYLMAGGTTAHARIAANALRTLDQALEVYRRTAAGWGTFKVYGPGDEVELASIGLRFPLAALYQRTGVPERLATADAEE